MGWFGNLLIWVGLFLVGKKNRDAFLWTIAGEAIWTAYAAYCGWWDLAVSCLVFIALAAYNWVQWGKDSQRRISLQRMESRLNQNGYFLRNDLILREGETWAAGCEEGYSLVTFYPSFERHEVYGGKHDWALERAYNTYIGCLYEIHTQGSDV